MYTVGENLTLVKRSHGLKKKSTLSTKSHDLNSNRTISEDNGRDS